MKFIYMDTNNQDADWIKTNYDLGFKTLAELSDFLGFSVSSAEMKEWLRVANSYPWVDNAPAEIRIAIRAHKDSE